VFSPRLRPVFYIRIEGWIKFSGIEMLVEQAIKYAGQLFTPAARPQIGLQPAPADKIPGQIVSPGYFRA